MRRGGHADNVTQLEITRDREAADAARCVLHIDAVKERSGLVIAGGIRGDNAFDGILVAGLRLLAHLGDRGDLHRIDCLEDVLQQRIVAVGCGDLQIEVIHERRAGNNDQALAGQLLGSHDEQTRVIFRVCVLRRCLAAKAVAVLVNGGAGCIRKEHGCNRCGDLAGDCAGGIDRVDRRTAVVGDAGGEALHQLAAAEAVQRQREGGVFIQAIVGQTQRRAELLKQRILRCSRVLCTGTLVVGIANAGDQQDAAGGVELSQSLELRFSVVLAFRNTAGGRRDDQSRVFAVLAGGDQLLRGVQHVNANRRVGSNRREVAHQALVVAGNILVVVRSVNADIGEAADVLHIKIDGGGEGVLLAFHLDHDRHGDGRLLCKLGNVLPVDAHGAVGRKDARRGVGKEDLGAFGGVDNALDLRVGAFLVVKLRRERDRFTDNGVGGVRSHLGDAELQAFADPDRCGDRQIAVSLRDLDIIVGIFGLELYRKDTGRKLRGIVPSVGDLTGVDDQLHLGDGVLLVRIHDGNIKLQHLGNRFNDGAHRQVIDRIAELKVLILRCVDTVVADRIVDALLRGLLNKKDVAGIVGVAPLCLVVVLVVGRSQMPALVQCQRVLLVAGIVTGPADLAFAVTDLNEVHAAVGFGIPIVEIREVAEHRARMVELGDGVLALVLRQQRVVFLHTRVAGLVVQRLVVTGNDTLCRKGVDVAGAAGPGHLKARETDDALMGLIELRNGVLVGRPALLRERSCLGHVVQCLGGVGGVGRIEVVGVVREGNEVNVRAFRKACDIVQSHGQRACTVGILAVVGVELAEEHLVAGLTDDEVPGLRDGLAVSAGDRDGDRNTPVLHVGGRLVADLVVLVGEGDVHTVHTHRDSGVRADVCKHRRDLGALVVLGLGVCDGANVGDAGLVLDLDVNRGVDGDALVVGAIDTDGQLLTLDVLGRDDSRVVAVELRVRKLHAVHSDMQLLHAEQCVDREMQHVALTGQSVRQVAENSLRLVDDAVSQLGVCAGIEVIGKYVAVGDVVHSPRRKAAGEVLEVLALVLKGRIALHAIAAVVGFQRPVCVVRQFGGVVGVVARAIGAEIAERLVVEAVELAALGDREDHGAVVAERLAVLDLSAGRADRAAVNIRQVAGHAGQNTLGQQVVDGNLVTCVRQAGLFVVFEQTVDRNCLLVLGAIAGENACRVVADGVGALVRLGGDGRGGVRSDINGKGAVDILFVLRAQPVAALRAGAERCIEIAGVVAVQAVQRERSVLNAGLKLNDLCAFRLVAEQSSGLILDDRRIVAVVRLLGLAHCVVQLLDNNQNAVAGGERGGILHDFRLVLAEYGRDIDRVFEGDLAAVLHAFLDCLHGEGDVLRDGNRSGVGRPVRSAVCLVKNGRVFGRAGEGDLIAVVNFTGTGRRLGRCNGLGDRAAAAAAIADRVETEAEVFSRAFVVEAQIEALALRAPAQLRAHKVLDKEHIGAFRRGEIPVERLVAQRQLDRIAFQILTAVFKGILLALFAFNDADRPDVLFRIAGHHAVVRNSYIRSDKVALLLAVRDSAGQCHAAGRLIEHDLVACRQFRGKAAG